MANKQKAEDFKAKGNKEFSSGNFNEAIKLYTKAIEADGTNHLYFSNRSAAYAGLLSWDKALEDASKSIQINKTFVKGYYRKGLAEVELKRYEVAVKTLKEGLALDPNSADVKDKLKEAEHLYQKNKPKVRVNPDGSPMSAAMVLKEDGNDLFKESKYEQAIDKYTQAIASVSPKDDPTQIAPIYNNRAACHQQYHNYTEMVKDCTESLKLMPNNNIKALIRRGFAFEALEKLEKALEDLRAALLLDPSNDAAQQAANRISNAIRRRG